MFGPGGVSPFQLLIVLALAFVFFGGKGKLSSAMSDLAKGLRGFRQGLSDDPEAVTEAPAPQQPAQLAIATTTSEPAKIETTP